jgi:hypothetical protein
MSKPPLCQWAHGRLLRRDVVNISIQLAEDDQSNLMASYMLLSGVRRSSGQSTAWALNLPRTGLTNTQIDCSIDNSRPGTDESSYVSRAASVTKLSIHAHGFQHDARAVISYL